jgi:hypothetical protein
MASGVGIEISGTTYPECMGWKLFCPRRFVIVLCPNNNTQIHLHTFGFLNAPREKDCHNPMQTRPVCPACLPVPAFLGNRQAVGYLAGLRNCIYMYCVHAPLSVERGTFMPTVCLLPRRLSHEFWLGYSHSMPHGLACNPMPQPPYEYHPHLPISPDLGSWIGGVRRR